MVHKVKRAGGMGIFHKGAVAWVLFAAVMFASSAWGLDPHRLVTQYRHDHWGTADGLPQVTVNDLVQSRDGYLWLATQEGLVRFDGQSFVIVGHLEAGFPSKFISRLLEDEDGSLWIGTDSGGLVKYHGDEVVFYTERDGLSSNVIRALATGRGGGLWVGTARGLVRLQGGKFSVYPQGGELEHKSISAVLEDSQGRLWIGTLRDGLYLSAEGELKRMTTADGLGSNSILSLAESRDGTVWVGTEGGGLDAIRAGLVSHFGVKQGLPASHVASIYEDGDGNIWLGTRFWGLVRFSGGEFSVFNTEDGLSHRGVRSLLEDREGNLWVGTQGGGLNRLRTPKFLSVTALDGLPHSSAVVVYERAPGELWIGTEKGLSLWTGKQVRSYPGEELFAEQLITSLFQDSRGSFWVGSLGGGVWRREGDSWKHFTTADGLASDKIYVISEDERGVMLFGTGTGLSRYDGHRFQNFTVADGLPADDVRVILHDKKGNLWVGSAGGGLARRRGERFVVVNPEGFPELSRKVLSGYEDNVGDLWFGTAGGLLHYSGGRFNVYTTADGLFDDAAFAILEDDVGHLWMSCNRGVYRVNKQQLLDYAAGQVKRITYDLFGHDDGMPSVECNGGVHPAGWRTADGRLWFVTTEGATSIDPSHIPINDLPPPVTIERAKAEGKSFDLKGPVVLEPGKRSFEIHYTALSLTEPKQNRFRYKLEGFDHDWVDASGRRVAYYNGVPPGKYTFRVVASNNDGVWNDNGDSLVLELEPYFHQTVPFYVLCGLLAVILGVGIGYTRISHLKRREGELKSVVDARTAELQQANVELQELALRDPLTGLRNRRFLFETIHSILEEITQQWLMSAQGRLDRRDRQDAFVVGLFMIDLDHFKNINDTMGHDRGDEALKQVAGVLKSCVRAGDVVVRWGGEEFLVVLPRTKRRYLDMFAERIRSRVEAKEVVLPFGETVRTTCSVGYASFPFYNNPNYVFSLNQVISLSDFAMYEAKKQGRNRCVHVVAGERLPESDDEFATLLTSLEDAIQSGFVKIETRH